MEEEEEERKKPRRGSMSLIADILMFVLGVFSFLFVNAILGLVLIILSIILYGVYRWITRRFEKMAAERAD